MHYSTEGREEGEEEGEGEGGQRKQLSPNKRVHDNSGE